MLVCQAETRGDTGSRKTNVHGDKHSHSSHHRNVARVLFITKSGRTLRSGPPHPLSHGVGRQGRAVVWARQFHMPNKLRTRPTAGVSATNWRWTPPPARSAHIVDMGYPGVRKHHNHLTDGIQHVVRARRPVPAAAAGRKVHHVIGITSEQSEV